MAAQKLGNLNWFPGHMAKAYKLIKDNLACVDGILELLDARAPISSKSPELEKLIIHRPRIMLLNKSDLADPEKTEDFKSFFSKKFNAEVLVLDCSKDDVFAKLLTVIRKELTFKQKSSRGQAMLGRAHKLMVLGVPNVGKSTLINKAAKGKKLVVQNKPGVTRAKQWIKVSSEIELLDMPGVLWPKFESEDVGARLALIGSIRDDILDLETISYWLIDFLAANYPQTLSERYKLEPAELLKKNFEILELIACRRGLILGKGEADCARAAKMLTVEFRTGQLGRITLDCLPTKEV